LLVVVVVLGFAGAFAAVVFAVVAFAVAAFVFGFLDVTVTGFFGVGTDVAGFRVRTSSKPARKHLANRSWSVMDAVS
jgi:hypothetical protein